MNYSALDFKSLSLNEQEALALLFCNMFATESRRWIMYFSEWQTDAGDVTSNAQVRLLDNYLFVHDGWKNLIRFTKIIRIGSSNVKR